MKRWPIAIFCLLAACGPSPRESPRTVAIAAALDTLVPGARIGAPAAPIAQRLNLPVEPYIGYANSDHQGARGVRGVALQVDDNLASETDRPSPSARIKGVVLTFASAPAVDSMLTFLTRKIGPPEQYCFRPAHKPARAALYFWPDRPSHGVLLVVRSQDSRQSFVAFGAIEPDSNSSFEGALTPGTCDAA